MVKRVREAISCWRGRLSFFTSASTSRFFTCNHLDPAISADEDLRPSIQYGIWNIHSSTQSVSNVWNDTKRTLLENRPHDGSRSSEIGPFAKNVASEGCQRRNPRVITIMWWAGASSKCQSCSVLLRSCSNFSPASKWVASNFWPH